MVSEKKRLDMVRCEVQQVAGEFEARVLVDGRMIDFAVHASKDMAIYWSSMRKHQISDVVDDPEWRAQHGLQPLD